MQKLIIISAGLLFSWMVSSCKKEHLDTYSTDDSIYFENLDPFLNYNDSSTITFAYSNDLLMDSAISIKIKVTGPPSDQPRPFKMTADASSTAIVGKHYQALSESYSFPANQVEDTIQVKLLRAADLKQKTVDLVLQLVPSISFNTDLVGSAVKPNGIKMSYLKYKVALSDILIEPAGWIYNLGKFTKKKLDLVARLGGVAPTWFIYGEPVGGITTAIFRSKRTYMVDLLNNYLLVNKLNGSPVLYEDGTPMRTDDY